MKPAIAAITVVAWLASGCASQRAMRQELAETREELERFKEDLDDTEMLLGQEELQREFAEMERNSMKARLAMIERVLAAKDLAREIAERTADAYREIANKLRAAFDTGQLQIIVRNGLLVVQMPNQILFDLGKHDLKPEGLDALAKLAVILEEHGGRDILLAGHTDNIPVKKKSKKYRSNWELSTRRSLAVAEFLQKQGVDPKRLGVAGYGEYLPEAGNDTEEGRARNRRTEVIIMPKIDEMPRLPLDI